MRTIYISSQESSQSLRYPIYIGRGLIEKLNELIETSNYTSIAIVFDDKVKHLSKQIKKIGFKDAATLFITGGEECKDINSIKKIWQFFKKNQLDRKSLIIAVGGGSISDAVGFAASTYMRGIDIIYVPTTLLAQVDASIGSKVGVNFLGVKNLIGSFHHPKAVIIDPDTVNTLPAREFIAGFGEILKHGLISDGEYFSIASLKLPLHSDQLVEELISKSCKIKSDIVSNDPYEKGARKLLNFGHTIGHALESLSFENNSSTLSAPLYGPLLHGEAISLGIIAESYISVKKGLLNEDKFLTIKTGLQNVSLPTTSHINISFEKLIDKISLDKKKMGNSIRCVLLKNIGEAVYDVEVSVEEIRESLEALVE